MSNFFQEMRALLSGGENNEDLLTSFSSRIDHICKAADSLDGSKDRAAINAVMTRVFSRLSGKRELKLGAFTLKFTTIGLKVYHSDAAEPCDISWGILDQIKSDVLAGGTILATHKIHQKLIDMMKAGQKIKTIKVLREMYGDYKLSLKEAKDAVDGLEQRMLQGGHPTYQQLFKGIGHYSEVDPDEACLSSY